MQDSATQTKGHSLQTLTEKTEIENGWHTGVNYSCVRRYKKLYMLTNMDHPPAEGSFCDENKKALKPPTAEHYKKRTSYVNENNQTANSYLTTSPTFKWPHSFCSTC